MAETSHAGAQLDTRHVLLASLVGSAIGAALVGGSAPIIATLLLAADHGQWRWIAAFIALSAAISLAAVMSART